MIKTNQVLSLGWSLSFGKIREKFRTNQQPSLSSDKSKMPYKVRMNKINIDRAFLLLSMPKKVKEALKTDEWKQNYLNLNIC